MKSLAISRRRCHHRQTTDFESIIVTRPMRNPTFITRRDTSSALVLKLYHQMKMWRAAEKRSSFHPFQTSRKSCDARYVYSSFRVLVLKRCHESTIEKQGSDKHTFELVLVRKRPVANTTRAAPFCYMRGEVYEVSLENEDICCDDLMRVAIARSSQVVL